jgi:cytochrome c oxidase subunit 4
MNEDSDTLDKIFKKQAWEDFWVWLALLILLGLTYGASYLHWGIWTSFISFTIAAIKTALIALFYMHLKKERGMTRIFAIAGIAWLMILFSLTLSDYISRSWLPYPSRWPVILQLRPGLPQSSGPNETQAPQP